MDITSINDGLTKKMVKSKSNSRVKLTQKIIGFIRHGSFTFTSQERAREIMRRNFFGVEEAIEHFGVNPSKRELAALAAVPFSEETLNACKHITSWSLPSHFQSSTFAVRWHESFSLVTASTPVTQTPPTKTSGTTSKRLPKIVARSAGT
jgi:hypothetical protein